MPIDIIAGDKDTIRQAIRDLVHDTQRKKDGMYTISLTGNENTDIFPWSVIDRDGRIVNSYSHRAVADQVADRLNTQHTPASVEGYDEVDEQMPG